MWRVGHYQVLFSQFDYFFQLFWFFGCLVELLYQFMYIFNSITFLMPPILAIQSQNCILPSIVHYTLYQDLRGRTLVFVLRNQLSSIDFINSFILVTRESWIDDG